MYSAEKIEDFKQARIALNDVLSSDAEDLRAIDSGLDDENAARKSYLDQEVTRWLPDISNATLVKLRDGLPNFLDQAVLRSFEDNHKLLGLFATSAYTSALVSLRTRLSLYLEMVGASPLAEFNTHIASLLNERKRLETRRCDIVALLKLLEGEIEGRIELSEENLNAIAEIAAKRRARVGNAYQDDRRNDTDDHDTYTNDSDPSFSVNNTSSSVSPTDSISRDSSRDDLGSYYMANIPASLHTQAHDSMSQHYRGESSTNTSNTSNPDTDNNDDANSFAASIMGDGTGSGHHASCHPIATDERLGNFS